MGVSFDEINQTISVAAGSNYVNDYTNNGRVQQVIVQADAPYRMQPEQLLALSVKNRLGQMLPLSAFVTLSWNVAPQQLIRYQGYPAIRITGSAAQGKSSGTAMAAMDDLAKHLPPGFAGEWAGSSLQEKRVCITASGSYCALGTGGIHGAGCSIRKLVSSLRGHARCSSGAARRCAGRIRYEYDE